MRKYAILGEQKITEYLKFVTSKEEFGRFLIAKENFGI